jgi:hypothetical protein
MEETFPCGLNWGSESESVRAWKLEVGHPPLLHDLAFAPRTRTCTPPSLARPRRHAPAPRPRRPCHRDSRALAPSSRSCSDRPALRSRADVRAVAGVRSGRLGDSDRAQGSCELRAGMRREAIGQQLREDAGAAVVELVCGVSGGE